MQQSPPEQCTARSQALKVLQAVLLTQTIWVDLQLRTGLLIAYLKFSAAAAYRMHADRENNLRVSL